MSWKLDLAVNRIFKALKRNKNNIFSEDIEALKTISQSINSNREKMVVDNILFAKLLSIHLRHNLIYYGNMETALISLKKELSNPIDYNLQFLHKELNNREFENYLKSLNINTNHLESNSETDNAIISENEKQIIEKLKKSWSYENVEKSFYNTVNEIIKKIEFYE